MLVLLVLSLVGLVFSSHIHLFSDNEDSWLTVPEIITKYGYSNEVYHVVTPDYYNLTIHRILPKVQKTSMEVVYLQHGLFGSSADWIITGPDTGLAYLLADNGYDVWMGNSRGNKFARKHMYLNPDTSDEFWDFTLHEMGYYDVPATIDFILDKTNQKKLFHVGFSQGTTSFYVMTSMRPEYNSKIKAHFSLAPIAYMDHMTSPIMQLLSLWEKQLSFLTNLIGLREFFPNHKLITMGINLLCAKDSPTQVLCTTAIFAICGFSPNEVNTTLFTVLSGHAPAGSSIKQLWHYAQEINSGYFRRYDYGFVENMQKYGLPKPPSYDLSKITAPVYLHYSKNDWLAGVSDVHKLYKGLGNFKGAFLVADHSFNHLDFLFAKWSRDLVYNTVLELMQRL